MSSGELEGLETLDRTIVEDGDDHTRETLPNSLRGPPCGCSPRSLYRRSLERFGCVWCAYERGIRSEPSLLLVREDRQQVWVYREGHCAPGLPALPRA